MSNSAQSGFTLVETIIVMAISSALAVMALMGFSALRGQAQFSNAVEQTNQSVLARRQEALATIKQTGTVNNCVNTPADQCNVNFGRVLTFTPGSSQVRVQTLVTLGNPAPAAGQAVTLPSPAETSSFTLPWGVTYVSSSLGVNAVQVAFVRSTVDGTLQTAVSPNGGWTGMGTGTYQYSNFAPGGAAVRINVQDPSGRKAYLTVDPSSNSVTRTYQ